MKVVDMDGRPVIVPGQTNQELIEMLERRLAEAKNGNILAMAFACVTCDMRLSTGWSDAGLAVTGNNLLAGIALLQHRVAKASLGDDER